MKAKSITVLTSSIVIAIGLYFVLRTNNENAPVAQPARLQYIAAEGKVEARPGFEVDVGSELTARIERFVVNEGQYVEQGQVVVVLDDHDLAARLRQAQSELAVVRAKRSEVAAGARAQEIEQANAALERARAEQVFAEREFARVSALFKERNVPQAAHDQSESALKVASARVAEAEEQRKLLLAGPRRETLVLHEAQIAQAEANVNYVRTLLDKTRVVAPISGTLITRYLDAGEVVVPEKPIAVIADSTHLRINVEVDETDSGRLHLGDPVEISAYSFPGQTYRGQIEEIAQFVGKREIRPNNPAVNLGLKIIQVKIGLPADAPLKLGMTVGVRITPSLTGSAANKGS